MLADLAERYGIPLAADENGEWPEPVLGELAGMPALTPIRNPIDTGNFGGKRLLDSALEAISDGGLTGPTLAFLHTVLLPNKVESEARAIIKRRDRTGSPAVVVTPGGLEDVFMDLYAENGIPVFRDTLTAFESLRAHYSTLPAPVKQAASRNGLATGGLEGAGAKLQHAAERGGDDVLSELESAEILRDIGVPMVESRQVATPAEARVAAAACGYPVVLKALVPGVAHKNDLGFVVTGIVDAPSLERAFEQLRTRALRHGGAGVTYILQPMLSSKAELIAGVSRQDGLGHFLVAGLGGIYAEALDVVTLIPAPADAATIRATLQTTKLGPLISKIGGSGPGLWDALSDVLHALSCIVEAHGDLIESVDINPLLITEQGCVAVDALVVLRKLQEANV
jgi:acetate---CoA ligase (ADP-forming)